MYDCGCDVDVLEHRVLLAIIQHGTRQTGHDLFDKTPRRTANNQEAEERPMRLIAAHDPIHENEHECRGQRFGQKVEQEEPRIGPVALRLPFQPGSRA